MEEFLPKIGMKFDPKCWDQRQFQGASRWERAGIANAMQTSLVTNEGRRPQGGLNPSLLAEMASAIGV